MSRKFALVAEKAHLPEHIKQHSLRHTFATRLLASGVDISIVSKLLGHTSIETTMIYAKATPEVLRDAIGTLDSLEHNKAKAESGHVLVTPQPGNLKLLGE